MESALFTCAMARWSRRRETRSGRGRRSNLLRESICGCLEMSGMDDFKKPILPGKGASDYERYLHTDELLSLQKSPEEFLHPDEMTFQVVHQASELLLKGVAWELERARTLIADGDFFNSAQLLRRGNHMLEYPISMLHELETITPYDYHLIRAGLGHGSGLDSPGFLGLLHMGPRLGEAFQEQ